MNDFDLIAALERVKSEISGALLSIHSYRSVEPDYFARMKAAIADAAKLFDKDGLVPPSFLHELEMAAQILRNEATAFEGRTAACLGMVEWLDATLERMTSLIEP
jgi:hypothetical protein